MTDQPDHPDRSPTTRELVAEFVKERFLSVLFVLGVGIGLLWYLNVDFSLPREAEIFGLAFLVLLPVGFGVAQYVVSLLWSPDTVYLLDIDARQTDGALYAVPRDHYLDLDVIDGELDELTPSLVIGKNVDLEAGTVEGTWRGTKSDRELLRELEKIDECRNQLEQDAQRGFAIRAKAWSIIRNATRKATLSVVDTFESGTLPDDGESIEDEIEKAIEQFDLDRELDSDDPISGSVPDDRDDLDDDLLEDRDVHADGPPRQEEPADD